MNTEALAEFEWKRGLLDIIEEWLFEPCACLGYEHEDDCSMAKVDPEVLATKIKEYVELNPKARS